MDQQPDIFSYLPDLVFALSAIGIGVLASIFLYWLLNFLVNLFPRRVASALQPYAFIAPVLALVGGFLVWPTIQTIYLSFTTTDPDTGEQKFSGFDNFNSLFGDTDFLSTLFNNLLWILVVPAASVVLGLLIATVSNNVGPIREKVAKSIIFLPMAISFVAASTMWRFLYNYDAGNVQVGLLNAIVTGLGGNAVPWMQITNFKLNDLLLMVIVIWLNTGFSMVLLSAAIKAVPEETVEAAAIDGATGRQTFFKIVLPQIRATAVSVFITVLIGVMKIFDVVYAMTGGNFDTNVLGVAFIKNYFEFGDTGKASAIVVLLMLAIIPIMIYQVYSYRKQEELR